MFLPILGFKALFITRATLVLGGGLLLAVYMVKEKKKRYQEDENTQTPSTDDKELSQQG